jgi:lysophospholipase L1-like esterase
MGWLLACATAMDSGIAEPSGPCFSDFGDPDKSFPKYDGYAAVVAEHCGGTDHQDIEGVERLVFLGDSVTAGTPPTPEEGYYRNLVTDAVVDRFGEIEVTDCSEWGARTDDLLAHVDRQIPLCFPDEQDPRRTLVIMTVGGNDFVALGESQAAGSDYDTLVGELDAFVVLLEDAVRWLKDPSRFPGGLDLIYANVYEYTDATGDLLSCPMAETFGIEGDFSEGGQDAYNLVNQRYMQVAVQTGADVVLAYENFCGHGFHRDDPESPCYRGEGTEAWFDPTCIHPSEIGHEEMARMFVEVIDG